MQLLILGMLLLVGIHLLPTFVNQRKQVIDKLGFIVYQALFGLIALLGLVLIVLGMSRAEFQAVWQPPVWGNDLARVLMLPASILLVGAYLPSNIKRYTRHPMLWGVVLWSVGHLFANGDLASLILFGGLGGYALFDMASANYLRGAAKQTRKLPVSRDVLVILAGVVIYAGLIYLHPYLFGSAVI